MTNKLIAENSTLATDMQVLYDIVALQTKSKLQQFKITTNKQKIYQNLKNISKAQSNLKEFLIHYHGIGFTNTRLSKFMKMKISTLWFKSLSTIKLVVF